jgi:hypothetical protein
VGEEFCAERGKIVEAMTNLRPRRVTREELHAMVWQKPMSRLAEEFGIKWKRSGQNM